MQALEVQNLLDQAVKQTLSEEIKAHIQAMVASEVKERVTHQVRNLPCIVSIFLKPLFSSTHRSRKTCASKSSPTSVRFWRSSEACTTRKSLLQLFADTERPIVRRASTILHSAPQRLLTNFVRFCGLCQAQNSPHQRPMCCRFPSSSPANLTTPRRRHRRCSPAISRLCLPSSRRKPTHW